MSINRRKFRSQPSDNMDRWKSRGGKSQRGEEQNREDKRRERVRRKKMQVREKVWKSCTFSTSQLPKVLRTRQFFLVLRATTSCTFSTSQLPKVLRTRQFLVLRATMSCNFSSLIWPHGSAPAALASLLFNPAEPQTIGKTQRFVWCEAHLEVKMYKALHVRTTFGRSDVVSRGRHKGLCTLSKVSKTWRFCCISMAGVGHSKRICKNRFRVAGTLQERFSSEMLGGQASDFLRGAAFWSIGSSVLGTWFCVTGAALCMTWHHFFVAGAAL